MSKSINTRKIRNKLINKMRKETHFLEQFECDNIMKIFEELTASQPLEHSDPHNLHRDTFRHYMRENFNMTDDLLLDRIFRAFDTDNDNKLKPEEWFHGMSTILRGNLAEKVEFAFRVYDINNDGYLSREDMHQFLKHAFLKSYLSDEEYEESVRDLGDLFVKLLKKESGDGNKFSVEEFKDAVVQDELILESLGQFLPSEKFILMFEDQVFHPSHHD